MPGFDGTGPSGNGAITGGGRGYCARGVGETMSLGRGQRMGRRRGLAMGNRAMGARFGMSRGRRMGIGRIALERPGMRVLAPESSDSATLSVDQEIRLLQEQADSVRSQLQSIDRRLTELNQSGSET